MSNCFGFLDEMRLKQFWILTQFQQKKFHLVEFWISYSWKNLNKIMNLKKY